MLVLELMVLHQQQQGLEHRDGEHAVGQDRQQDVREDARLFVDDLYRTGGRELRQQHRRCAQREQQYQQVFHRNARACQQGQGNDGGSDQARGAEKVQAQADWRQQVSEQAGAVSQDRQHAERDQQPLVRLGAGSQASALIDSRSGIQAGGGESS
ncbi:hypothetical protein D3C73_1247080 [compost metagenome]